LWHPRSGTMSHPRSTTTPTKYSSGHIIHSHIARRSHSSAGEAAPWMFGSCDWPLDTCRPQPVCALVESRNAYRHNEWIAVTAMFRHWFFPAKHIATYTEIYSPHNLGSKCMVVASVGECHNDRYRVTTATMGGANRPLPEVSSRKKRHLETLTLSRNLGPLDDKADLRERSVEGAVDPR
jgi:hypothetical protein